MLEKILVPLDGSELAEVALPYAEELAGRLRSEVTLVSVSEPPESRYRSYLDRMVEGATRGAEEYLEKPDAQAIRIKSEVLRGNPAERIVDYAEGMKIGLIVISTHGRSGIRRWSLGSVADKVIRATNLPVLLIRASGTLPAVRRKEMFARILVPLDGSREGESALPRVGELAANLKSEVILFQALELGYRTVSPSGCGWVVNPVDQLQSDKTLARDYLDNMGSRLKQQGVSAVQSEVGFGDAAEEIIKLANDKQADVVAISTHGWSGIKRWVFGSVAERVLFEGKIPVLLVRASRGSQDG